MHMKKEWTHENACSKKWCMYIKNIYVWERNACIKKMSMCEKIMDVIMHVKKMYDW